MDLSNKLLKLYHKLGLYPLIIKTGKGLTNDIYLIYLDNQKYILRMPNKDINNLLIKDEEAILKQIAKTDLDVKELYYDPITKVRITKYIEDTHGFKDYHNPYKYLIAIDLIKALHNANIKSNEEFNLKIMYKTFKSRIKKPLMNYHRYEIYFNKLRINEKTFSHNDLVSGNFLFCQDRAYLIDYEYAANNHPYFDLISFISENNIDDPRLRELLIRYYFKQQPDEATKEELHNLFIISYLLWAAWANMLYDSRKEDIYLTIFKDKYAHLLIELKKTS